MSDLESLIPAMRNVARCEKQLGELEFTWRLIETTARMICPEEAKTILPTMAATRSQFGQLEQRLVTAMAEENLKKVVLEIGSKAQVVVDIVIRNLFERTADVGFLATDDDIRGFLEERAPSREAIQERLREYIAKYSVYDEILVLSPAGEVLAQLDSTRPIATSSDPLIAQTLASDTFVETFRASDLRPGLRQALIYSRRIDSAAGEPLGVLCLCFRFDNEMESIFRELRRPRDRTLMLLLDQQGCVIASSDEDHVPRGRTVPTAPDTPYHIFELGGREYIAATCRTTGYQGYFGLGWLGHVMIPVDAAFRETGSTIPASEARGAEMLCGELQAVSHQAEAINLSLRRVVWNGQVMSGADRGDQARLKSVLEQISETGERMSRVFSDAMHNLADTVTSSSLQDLQFISRLMVDIMDRNLYERANDCRWWALASRIRAALAKGEPASGQEIEPILNYINSLYTVYTRLFVYDAAGRILAASNLNGDDVVAVGQVVEPAILAQVARLPSTQAYCVSPFAASPLYGNRPTYVYHAAIRDPGEPGRIAGGIGIVFDSETELRAMLGGALPRRAGAWAAFCDRSGAVISATRDDVRPGQRLPLGSDLLTLANGSGCSRIVDLDGRPHLLGATMSSGYREYKNSGDYENDVLALVLLPLAVADTTSQRSQEARFEGVARAGEGLEYATFLFRERYLAIAATAVVEAADVDRLNTFGACQGQIAGVLPFLSADGGSVFVPVLSLHDFFGVPAGEARGHIIITRTRYGLLGLLVDELHQVVEFSREEARPMPELLGARFGWIERLIGANGGKQMITAICPDAIYEMLKERIQARFEDLERYQTDPEATLQAA